MTTESRVGTNFFSKKTPTLDIAFTDQTGNAIFAKCTGTPPTTADIFAHGCLMIQSNSGTGNQAIWENIGSSAVPSWNLLGTVIPGAISLTDGHIMVGDGAGLAADVGMTGDVEIDDTGKTTIQPGAVDVGKTSLTITFTGTQDTITPTAALDAAPTFTGTQDTISPTAALDAAPAFTGAQDTITAIIDASGYNASSAVTGTLAQANNTQVTNTITYRLYTGIITGTVPSPGNTLLQATTGTTGTISVVGVGYLDLSVHSADFSTVDLVTISSGGTFTPPQTLIDVWTLSPACAWLYYATSNTAVALGQIGPTVALIANSFRQISTTAIETLDSDGWTSINAGYVGLPTVNSLTAAAQAFTDPTFTGASYTPAGSNDAPSITVTGALYTPAGSNDAPSVTVTGALYTPAGSNAIT